MTSQQIRQQFMDFFIQKHAHTFVPSSPVVPLDDPTLLFTNAGMNQFKPIFLGQEKRSYTRAVNTQKCIRAGGKHNDLDDVGRSRRHHTFFEMLGNWSFGDYFKRGAIEMSWELLTKVWKLDPERIHVSCYEGNEKAGIPRDTEAANIWKEVAGVKDDHIHFFGKDNFWEMGDTGPCGPCTEIYYDRTPDKSGGPQVNGEDPRVMEIWNNVFIQYNRDASGKLTTLPAQHVDTGMGFERICQVLQGKDDNYGTDLWEPLFAKITALSGKGYIGRFPKTNAADPVAEAADAQLRYDIAFRVIADHVRCLTFALTDGAVPSNEGRGYVLRRILRRAARFGRQQLGLKEPFMFKLVDVIVGSMGEAFPELKKNPGHVVELIKDEEVSFGRTLDRGIQLFDEAAKAGRISGADAFKLHDTYGFPVDLTRIMAEERGMTVDIQGYEKLMEDARELARSGGKESDNRIFELPPDVLNMAQFAEPTDDSAKYSDKPVKAGIEAIWDGEHVIDSTHGAEAAGKLVAIKLDRTNFYAEMGGQVGDTGTIVSDSGQLDVTTTRLVGKHILHVGRMVTGLLRVGERVTATVSPNRLQTEKNHTSTHIANWALREVLGEGVQQKGSLVDPDKLRFDFVQSKAMTDDELTKVEELVAQQIGKKHTVYAENAPQEQALKINGLRAVFGEKYPPMVRVVSIGAPVKDLLADPTNAKWREYSIEFCGGTHLGSSAEAEAFCIAAEESVSKGIRRIVALTGVNAKAALVTAAKTEALIAKAKSAADAELPANIATLNQLVTGGSLPLRAKRKAQAAIVELQARHKAFQKTQKSAGSASSINVGAITEELISKATSIGDGKLIVADLGGVADETVLSAMDSLRKKLPSVAIMLGSAGESKVTFVAAVSDDLIAKGLKAGDWIRETAKVAGGGGGGRPQMAQAGGKDPSKLADALAKAREFAEATVK